MKSKSKVIVIGLPKTGTSTLTAMFRILNYKVTGPEIKFIKGSTEFLNEKIKDYDAFQDYPWAFEWQRFLALSNVKFIILYRDKEDWYKSFYSNYYGDGSKYLSYSYIKIKKVIGNKSKFMKFHDNYYFEAEKQAKKYPQRFLVTSIKSIEWSSLCNFLELPVPRDILGRVAKKPHINKDTFLYKKSVTYKINKKVRNIIIKTIGLEKFLKVNTFLRKNGLL